VFLLHAKKFGSLCKYYV